MFVLNTWDNLAIWNEININSYILGFVNQDFFHMMTLLGNHVFSRRIATLYISSLKWLEVHQWCSLVPVMQLDF